MLNAAFSRTRFIRDRDFLHRVLQRGPGIESAEQRTYARDASLSQLQRHPGAGRFVGSGAVEDDVAIARNLLVAHLQLFRRETNRAGHLH
jgi:hypothetical protein